VQPQCRYRRVKFIDDMKGLDVDGLLEIVKELLDGGESGTPNKCANEEVPLLAFDPHLANLPLLGIHQINDWLSTLLHVYHPVVLRKVAVNVSRFSSVNPATPLG
jgi:hypothetical protein